jgi:hypothetical protein
MEGAMISYVNKHGGGVNELPLSHPLIGMLMNLIDLIIMQIFLIDPITIQTGLYCQTKWRLRVENKYGGRAVDSLAPFFKYALT